MREVSKAPLRKEVTKTCPACKRAVRTILTFVKQADGSVKEVFIEYASHVCEGRK